MSTTDDITANFDPLIGEDYEQYLVDGVLSYYSTKERQFKSMGTIEKSVISMSNSLAGITLLNKDD